MFDVIAAGEFGEMPVFAGDAAGLEVEEGGAVASWGCGEGAEEGGMVGLEGARAWY